MRHLIGLFLLVIISGSLGCNGDSTTANTSNNASPSGKSSPGGDAQDKIPVYGYEIVNTYPHDPVAFRSEEHTSELESRSDLVCRLLLEKKKKQLSYISSTHKNHFFTISAT